MKPHTLYEPGKWLLHLALALIVAGIVTPIVSGQRYPYTLLPVFVILKPLKKSPSPCGGGFGRGKFKGFLPLPYPLPKGGGCYSEVSILIIGLRLLYNLIPLPLGGARGGRNQWIFTPSPPPPEGEERFCKALEFMCCRNNPSGTRRKK